MDKEVFHLPPQIVQGPLAGARVGTLCTADKVVYILHQDAHHAHVVVAWHEAVLLENVTTTLTVVSRT